MIKGEDQILDNISVLTSFFVCQKKHVQLDLVRRPRRLRQTQYLRDLVEETSLSPAQLIQPIFISDQEEPKLAIDSMPGMDCLIFVVP